MNNTCGNLRTRRPVLVISKTAVVRLPLLDNIWVLNPGNVYVAAARNDGMVLIPTTGVRMARYRAML